MVTGEQGEWGPVWIAKEPLRKRAGQGGSKMGPGHLGKYGKALYVGGSPVGLGVKWPFSPGSSPFHATLCK